MNDPTKTQLVAFRLPVELVEKVDKHAEKITATTDVDVSRTKAVIALLRKALRK